MATEPRTIAGHVFEGAGSDRKCVKEVSTGKVCGKYWDDVKLAISDRSNIGKGGFAHMDYLTATEYEQIEDEEKRLERLFGPEGFKS